MIPSIASLKSWLSINTAVGCARGCVYCNRTFYGIGDKPEQLVSPQELVTALLADWRFVPNRTPLSINSRGIDPFAPDVREQTLKTLDELSARGLHNIAGLITRGPVHPEDVARIAALKNLRVVVLFSFSGLPREFEPTSYQDAPKIASLTRLNDAGVPVIFYLRPIIERVNDTPETLSRLFKIAGQYTRAIVRESVRPNATINATLTALGVTLTAEQGSGDAMGRKILSGTSRDRINTAYEEAKIAIPLFKKTSCAVSYLFEEPDYNAHWSNAERFCATSCPAEQRARCATHQTPSDTRDTIAKAELSVRVLARAVETVEELSYAQRMFLKHTLRVPVLENGVECECGM